MPISAPSATPLNRCRSGLRDQLGIDDPRKVPDDLIGRRVDASPRNVVAFDGRAGQQQTDILVRPERATSTKARLASGIQTARYLTITLALCRPLVDLANDRDLTGVERPTLIHDRQPSRNAAGDNLKISRPANSPFPVVEIEARLSLRVAVSDSGSHQDRHDLDQCLIAAKRLARPDLRSFDRGDRNASIGDRDHPLERVDRIETRQAIKLFDHDGGAGGDDASMYAIGQFPEVAYPKMVAFPRRTPSIGERLDDG